MVELVHTETLARLPGEAADGVIVARHGLRVAALRGLAQMTVSLHPGSARRRPATDFKRAVGDLLGARLPSAPNTLAGRDPYALWIAPQRWRLVGPRSAKLPGALGAALAAVDAAAVAASISDVSDASLLLEIDGVHAVTLLAMACSLDLGAASLAQGRCAQSPFAGQPALFYRRGDGFRVHLDATLGGFVCDWCRQAALLIDA